MVSSLPVSHPRSAQAGPRHRRGHPEDTTGLRCVPARCRVHGVLDPGAHRARGSGVHVLPVSLIARRRTLRSAHILCARSCRDGARALRSWSSRRPLPETREAYRRLVRCMPGGLQLIFAGTSTGSDRRRGREMPGPIRTRRWQDDGQNGGLQRDRANLSQTARSRSARARRRARDPRGGWAHHRTSAAGPFSLELGSAS